MSDNSLRKPNPTTTVASDPEHLEILSSGIAKWNSWRHERPGIIPQLRFTDLSGFDLANANLSNVDFSRSNLSGTKLTGANLYQAEFFSANLRGANLNSADLRGAKLHNTDLREASLQHSDLFRADFIGSRLAKSNFKSARCWATAFSNVDLAEVIGLDDVVHTGPSSLDIFTLLNSGTAIPEKFLRGVGLPDHFIDYLPALAAGVQPSQFYSCFISYSTEDEAFADRLYRQMRDEHLRVWFAPEDIEGGKKIHEQIDNAIRLYDKLLLVLSTNSMQSEWVMTELRNARKVERVERKRKLFPIRLVDFEAIREWTCFDSDTGRDLAVELREYYIPDFSNWSDEGAFKSAFARLLRDLKSESAL